MSNRTSDRMFALHVVNLIPNTPPYCFLSNSRSKSYSENSLCDPKQQKAGQKPVSCTYFISMSVSLLVYFTSLSISFLYHFCVYFSPGLFHICVYYSKSISFLYLFNFRVYFTPGCISLLAMFFLGPPCIGGLESINGSSPAHPQGGFSMSEYTDSPSGT